MLALIRGSERAFFEIAATLIPLLLFGGVLAERAKPPPEKSWNDWHDMLAGVLLFFGGIALIAEALAIRAVVTGRAADPIRLYVAAVLVGGIVLVVLMTAFPWLVRLWNSDRGYFWLVVPMSVAGLAGAAFIGGSALIQGATVARGDEERASIHELLDDGSTRLQATRRWHNSLTLEFGRVSRQIAVAAAHDDAAAVSALRPARRTLERMLQRESKARARLLAEQEELIEKLEESLGIEALRPRSSNLREPAP